MVNYKAPPEMEQNFSSRGYTLSKNLMHFRCEDCEKEKGKYIPLAERRSVVQPAVRPIVMPSQQHKQLNATTISTAGNANIGSSYYQRYHQLLNPPMNPAPATSGLILHGGNTNPPPIPPHSSKPEVNAVRFVGKVQQRMVSDPNRYSTFLKLLGEFKENKWSIEYLLAKACYLFYDHQDLLVDFIFFFPASVQNEV